MLEINFQTNIVIIVIKLNVNCYIDTFKYSLV